MKRFAKPYAEVLLEAAVEAGADRQLSDELALFLERLQESPELATLAANPSVSPAEKEKVVAEIASRASFSTLTTRTLRLLARNYRLAQVGDILEAYRELLDRRSGIVPVAVTSATDLDADQRKRLETVLTETVGGQVRLELEINENLMAGLVVRVGSTVLDASLRGEIDKMKRLLADRESAGRPVA